MEFVSLPASRRVANGKGPANRIRREGKIPAVAYGRTLEAFPVAVDPNALVKILQGPNGLNTVLRLAVEGDGKNLLVMVRELTHHPVSRKFLHADFIEVKLEDEVAVDVPFLLTGKPVGIIQGGVLHQIYRKLPLRCIPSAIPASVSLDITTLAMGQGVKAQEIKLPDGVRVRLPAEQTVVAIVAPEKDRGEEEAAAAPGAAAPAAAAGKAPAGKDAKAAAPAKDAKAAAPAKKK